MHPTPSPQTPEEQLLDALARYGIPVLHAEGRRITVPGGYEIEMEQGLLFKLRHAGKVVAPFGDLDELCEFIQLG
ncbi:MAG: hypothetical protein NW241_04625 [Bacteroidia bacterium]|nr:hypothetical protein [Bacteroidia bacterium]